jgi:hypothetical protein
MKPYVGNGGIVPLLTAVTDTGEWSASRPGRFNPGEIRPRYPMNSRIGVLHSKSGRFEGEKIPLPLQGI